MLEASLKFREEERRGSGGDRGRFRGGDLRAPPHRGQVFVHGGAYPAQMPTTMSRSLPPEILDLIVDDLHYQSEALETCCIVSKSWIPRARKHLFAHVKFYASRSHVELWKKAFPDPSTSPAHHTRSLLICGIPVITAADAGVGGWICTFRNVVHLCFDHIYAAGRLVSLVPFYGLSPTVRSLNLNSVPDDLFGLICSFPLLEDLTMLCYPTLEANGWNSPTTLPKLTGSLHLRTGFEIRSAIHWFCALPGGLHFTKITVLFSFEDAESIVDLVSKCSDTLESLSVAFLVLSGAFPSISTIDTPYHCSRV